MSDPASVPSPAPAPPSPNQEFAEKVLTIERQRQEEALRQVQASAQEKIDALARELQEVKSSGKAQPAVDPRNPLAAIPEADLHGYYTNPEATVEQRQTAMGELMRRQAEKVKEDIRREQEAEWEHQRVMSDTAATIRKNYGEDIYDQSKPLGAAAERHMRDLQKRYGREVALDPKAQLLVASMAKEEMLRKEVEQKQEVERERDEYKRRVLGERGNQNIHRPDDDAKAFFKKGKVKEGLRALNPYQQLFGSEG